MRFAKSFMLSAACLAMSLGCSDATKTETKEAIAETGEAIQSAAEDAKANAAKAADAVEEGAREVREKLSGDATETEPAAEPAPRTP